MAYDKLGSFERALYISGVRSHVQKVNQKWRNLTSSARPLSAHPSFEAIDRADKNDVRGLGLDVKIWPFLASRSVYGKISEGLTLDII